MSSNLYFPFKIAGYTDPGTAKEAVYSPYHDRVIGHVGVANAEQVDHALTAAYQLFRDRKQWLSKVERIQILEKAIRLLEPQAEKLAAGAAEEGGKPLIDSRVEMTRCIDSLRACVDAIRHDAPQTIPMGINAASQHRMTTIRHEPIGVVVAISAFNHPLNLIAHQVGPAIAAGCPVIVKPAEKTPLSCFRLVDIFHQAGLPEAWCQVLLTENHQIAEQLATDPRVAFVSFIGSAKVGWYLRSKLAAGTRCALEHGGVAPVIVAKDANLDAIVPGLAKGSFYHAGQVCVSVQRIYVHESIAESFTQKLASAAQKMVVGDPLSDKTEVGPIIRKEELNRIAAWVKEAVDLGATLICGGQVLPFNCYSPTILLNPSAEAKVSTSEVFGPVVCVYAYSDLDEAIQQANALEFAFQASVYTQDIDTACFISDRLDASAVMVNEHTAFRVDWMPFAGLKHSGLGVGGIPYTYHDMQVEKMIVFTSKPLS